MMARTPLPIGTWGKIRTYVDHVNEKGKADRFRAVAQYRDFDGHTRQVEAYGRSATAAENALRKRLKDRSETGRRGELTAMHRFSDAVELWLTKFEALVADGDRSASSLDTYRRAVRLHVLPALGEVRLGEATTPVLDKFIGKIKADVGPPTAKTCRSVLSGVMGLATRYGAVFANPVREVDRIEAKAKKPPRALTDSERVTWLTQLRADEKAVRKDLPDLTFFMLATGVRIGEALAVLWEQIDVQAGIVEITHTIIRVKGEGLVRKVTKSSAGERALKLPTSATAMLRRRFMTGVRLDHPVFPDILGSFRDPANVRRDFRDARGEDTLAWITSHNFRKTVATILDEAALSPRQVADQLGHARPSMTQDVYMGRKVLNPGAAAALDDALRNLVEGENHG